MVVLGASLTAMGFTSQATITARHRPHWCSNNGRVVNDAPTAGCAGDCRMATIAALGTRRGDWRYIGPAWLSRRSRPGAGRGDTGLRRGHGLTTGIGQANLAPRTHGRTRRTGTRFHVAMVDMVRPSTAGPVDRAWVASGEVVVGAANQRRGVSHACRSTRCPKDCTRVVTRRSRDGVVEPTAKTANP
jgi:hypothetical protein